jgi:hypothetical protein
MEATRLGKDSPSNRKEISKVPNLLRPTRKLEQSKQNRKTDQSDSPGIIDQKAIDQKRFFEVLKKDRAFLRT